MKLASEEQPLALEIRDPEIREHTVASQIKIGIPFQIRAIREKRGLTQDDLAKKIGTTQNTISRLENPKTGKPTIKTLLRLARAFDVGLLVRFVPFGFYGDVINATDSSHIEIPSYEEEFQEQQEQEKAADQVEQEALTAGKLFPISGSTANKTGKTMAPGVTSSAVPVPEDSLSQGVTIKKPIAPETPIRFMKLEQAARTTYAG